MFKNILVAFTIGCSMLLVNTSISAKEAAPVKPAEKMTQQTNTKAPELKPLPGPRKLKPTPPPKPLKPSSSQ